MSRGRLPPSLQAGETRVASVLVQMSGVPGTGKSTLAAALGDHAGLAVLDTDVVKSALLDHGVPPRVAGAATYGVVLDLAADLLRQGRGVIVDSPCRYRELLDAGQRIAFEASVPYRMVELWADDVRDLLARLDERTPRRSQVASSTSPVADTSWEEGTAQQTLRAWQAQLVRPDEGWLRLDALRPLEVNLAAALAHLGTELKSPAT